MELNVRTIQEAFEQVKIRAEEFSSTFYGNLFQDYPHSENFLKHPDREQQKRLLFASLAQVVQNLENPVFLGEYLGKIGERYAAFGINDQHLDEWSRTFLKTLQAFFGSAWTSEFSHQWALVAGLSAALVRAGLNRAKKARLHDLNVVPFRKLEAEAVSKSVMPLPIHLPRELKDQLDKLAKHRVQAAIEDYLDQATQLEIQRVLGGHAQAPKKAS